MPVPASDRRLKWERKYRNVGEANFQLYCVNGHSISDELEVINIRRGDDAITCPFCGAGKPFLYRWEVD